MGKGKKSRGKGARTAGAHGPRGRGVHGPKGARPLGSLTTRGAGPSGPARRGAPTPPARTPSGPRDTDRLNALEVLCGRDLLPGARHAAPGFEDGLVPTVDPADRAHDVKIGGKMLLPAHVMRRGVAVANTTLPARPRRYPAHQVNGAGLAVDSQFDDWFEARKRLAGIAGVGVTGRVEMDAITLRHIAVATLGPERFRSRTRRATTQACDEPGVEADANEWLEKAGFFRKNPRS